MNLTELDKFYGRESSLEWLKRRVLDLKDGYRQNVAFLGERDIGKSMILQKFVADLEDDDLITVYLDLENKDLGDFYHDVAGSILYKFSKTKNLMLHEDIKLLVESTQDMLPQTVKTVRKIQTHISNSRRLDAYHEIISLPQIFAKEADKFCVLILDEFHHLENLGVPDVFQELGKKIMTQKRCLYVVASSLPGVAKRILSEKLSLLFGNFEDIEIEPFDLKTSRNFISFHLNGIRIGDPLRNFLVDFTGGHPLYIRLICRELVHLCAVHKQDEIFVPLLTQAVENVLFHRWGILSCHFDLVVSRMCPGKDIPFLPALLIALSEGRRKIKDFVHITGCKQSLLTQKMSRLIEMGIVVKNGNFYYLKDRLLRYWTRYVFQKRRRTIELDPDKERNQFREELARGIDNFNRNSQKDLPSRIVELLTCFENDAFYINGRRYRLPLFQEIVPTKVRRIPGKYFDVIKASTAQGDWFIALKTETIYENDINMVVKESKRLIQRPQRCILISLANLEENARLKALQERMWIWSEGELNTLLNLYDKPYIVYPESKINDKIN